MLLVTSGMFARAQESLEGHQTQAPAQLEPQTAHAPAAQAESQEPAN